MKTRPCDWLHLQYHFAPQGVQPGAAAEMAVAADTLLVDHVQPVFAAHRTRGEGCGAFFIRYFEGGYHLRLRMHGADAQQRHHAEADLVGAALDFAARNPAFAPALPSRRTLFDSGHLRTAAYVPELAKYGGADGQAVAEDHFACSSDVSLRALGLARRVPLSHLALWLLGEAVAASGLFGAEAATLLRSYAEFWMGGAAAAVASGADRFLRQAYAAHANQVPGFVCDGTQAAAFVRRHPCVAVELGAWRTGVANALARLAALEAQGRLSSSFEAHLRPRRPALASTPALARSPYTLLLALPNFIHMLNNRLGLNVMQEARLAYLLAAHLQARHGAEAAAFELLLQPPEAQAAMHATALQGLH